MTSKAVGDSEAWFDQASFLWKFFRFRLTSVDNSV